jgi:predicted nuclease of restriction endonuclease-like RecB superfamily
MKFKKSYLKNELDLPYSALVDEITDTSRWSIHHKIVFQHDGKFYSIHYSEGATEMQDESPWEYEEDVDCTEVELKEVKVMKWVPVK